VLELSIIILLNKKTLRDILHEQRRYRFRII
jgi:hypothetical protein